MFCYVLFIEHFRSTTNLHPFGPAIDGAATGLQELHHALRSRSMLCHKDSFCKTKKHVQETYAKQNNEAGSSIPPIHTSARRPIGHQTSTGQKVAHEKRVSTDLVAASWMAGSHPIHHLDVIKDGWTVV